ncbi:MAG: glucose 1-dehydrogenase [Chloroflexi bacterium]|nr:glucose 1-dehydrogenase [Chloroflexota bacterium]
MLLENKVALITGAASGIGRATAQLFAREGARVVVADVNTAGGQETVAGIRQAGGDAFFVNADVGKMAEVQALVQTALDRYGKIDIIYSNAALLKMGSATEITEEDWDRVLAVDLKATWMLAHCAVPSMLANGGGAIITTGSDHCIRGYARYTAYQAAKGGLLSLTRALAADYAPTIRVNAILPGAVLTGMSGNPSESEIERIGRMRPLKRYGLPEDIANAALFLASDMSSYITGTAIVVDGGMSSIMQT